MYDTNLFDPKQLSLAFTIGMIKPNTCLNEEKLKQIVDKIESQGFVIRNMIQRPLFKQQVTNIFYKHGNKSYFQNIIQYLLSGQTCVFLLTCQTEDPIFKWKKLIGNMEPQKAKKQSPNSLRALHGINIIQNQFYGSDNVQQANKQREVFGFPQPQSPPEYIQTAHKITFTELKKFLHPPNLQHPSLNQRLDLFALYGPVASWHSIQNCLCLKCGRLARVQLQIQKKKQPGKHIKLLKHKNIQQIKDQLCQKCHMHCIGFVHLFGGRQHQHILTDIQINQMGKQLNKNQLLELLIIQKGAAAKIMIQTIDIKQPKQVQYSMDIIQILISQLETDFYGRYDFTQLQHLILEDRRIRMAYWIGKLVQKAPQSFPPVTSLDNTLTKKQLNDPKSPFFTLQRTKPLSLTIKKQQIKHTPLKFSASIVDKPKLSGIQMNLAVQKKLHRNLTKVSVVGTMDKQGKVAATMLREYQEGRHGGWDNYSGLKGNSGKQPTGGRNMAKILNNS